MTHTLEVSRIARTIARALDLNEDLTEAIALGHDLGHTPFGHAGERMLAQLMPEGFAHYQQSVRVVDRLEKNGQGLNLTWEVRNGILCHTKGTRLLRWRARWSVWPTTSPISITTSRTPSAVVSSFPWTSPWRYPTFWASPTATGINTLVHDAITASQGQDHIVQSHPVEEAMLALKDFMFASVYTNPLAKGEEGKAQNMLQALFQYYQGNPDELPSDFQTIRLEDGVDRAVCDYIAGMTDPFAVEKYKELFIPKGWTVL